MIKISSACYQVSVSCCYPCLCFTSLMYLYRQLDQHESNLHSVEVVEEGMENGSKPNKKKKKQSKKGKELKDKSEDDFFSGSILKWDQAKQNETKVDQPSQDIDVKNEEDQRAGSYK